MTNSDSVVANQSKVTEKSVLAEHGQAAAMLRDFGLSESETAVYITLLEAGRGLGGSDIAKRATIPRQYVYTALPSLRRQGLIVEIPHGKQSRYRAVPQGEIEKIAKRKLVEAEKLVLELSTFSKVGYEQDFEIHVGAEAIQKYEYEWVQSIKGHKDQYIIGGNTKGFTNMMGKALNKYLTDKAREYITTYYLGNTAEKSLWQGTLLGSQNLRLKFLDKLPQGASHMVVREDRVLFYSFLKPELLYIIKSPAVADNYKQFFLMLWEMAGEGK